MQAAPLATALVQKLLTLLCCSLQAQDTQPSLHDQQSQQCATCVALLPVFAGRRRGLFADTASLVFRVPRDVQCSLAGAWSQLGSYCLSRQFAHLGCFAGVKAACWS